MIARKFIEKDHEILGEWLSFWGWPTMPKEAFPKNGLVVIESDKPLAMGFIYLTDSSIGWVEWITANPKIGSAERTDALYILIDGLKNLAKQHERKVLFSSMDAEKTPGLVQKMVDCGFKVADSKMTNLFMEIK